MKKIDRPRSEYLMVGENAPKKRKSNPKKCKNCGRVKEGRR